MKMRKIIAVIAAALMLFSILPMTAFAADTEIVFEFGANGSAAHKDGSSNKTTYSESNGDYTLSLTGGTNMYPSSYDAKGNSCIKLGSSSKTGGFSFTVPEDVTSVIIAAGKYKTNTTKLSVNGTTHTLTKNSNDGAYDDIIVDTTTNKTVTLITVSGGVRAMVNSITYVIPAAEGSCEHDYVGVETKAPDCTNAGEMTYTCSKCGESKTEAIAALGHSYGEATETVAPDCTNAGEQQSTCATCGDVKTEAVNALGHNYVDGFCSVCGEAKPLEVTIDTFANTGVLDGSTSISWTNGDFSVVNKKGSSSTAIRVTDADHFRAYVGNSFTVSGGAMSQVVINCTGTDYLFSDSANKVSDGWTVTVNGTTITYTATSGSADELTITIGKQSRVKSVVITPYVEAESDCEHDYVCVETQAPTCTVPGVTTYTCSKCEESYTEAIAVIPHNYVEDIIDATCTATGIKTYECSVCLHSYDETIPMKPHNYVDDVCADCGHVKTYKGTLIFDANKENRTQYTSDIQVWESEGLNLTNNRLSSNNIGDYGAPARFYKGSQIIITFPEMSKLIIDATDSDSDKLWNDTLTNAGLTYSVVDGIYTITFDEAVNSITLTAANQVRAHSITAIAAHECVWADATCTTPKTCSKCGTTEGEALGHTYFDDCSAICEACGYEREASHNIVHVEAVEATCNALGNIEYWYCDACGMAWLDEACTLNTNQMAVKLPMADHIYGHEYDVDCDVCGAVREVSLPIVSGGTSVSEDVSGVAALFNVAVEGLAVVEGTGNEADYTNATIGGYKLISMGVIATNEWSEKDIPCVYLCDLETDSAAYATRIINIPEDFFDSAITFQSYFIVEIDDVATMAYGESVTASYNSASN